MLVPAGSLEEVFSSVVEYLEESAVDFEYSLVKDDKQLHSCRTTLIKFQFICFAKISKYLPLYTYTYKVRKSENS